MVTIVATLQEVRLNVYFILISESSPYILSYRSIYSWENILGYFSNVLIEILVTNGWKQSFAKLPIPKLSLHISAAFYLWQKAFQRFAWKSHFLTLYTLASLNYTVSVSDVYSKASCIPAQNELWLYCCLSHVQLQYSHCYKKITFLTVYHTG